MPHRNQKVSERGIFHFAKVVFSKHFPSEQSPFLKTPKLIFAFPLPKPHNLFRAEKEEFYFCPLLPYFIQIKSLLVMLKNLSVLVLVVFAGVLNAQALWSDISEQSIALKGERRVVPQTYRTVRLDLSVLQPTLTAAPERFTPAAAGKNSQPVLTLPMPGGGTASFRLTESPVMAPELQAQFPEIRTYTGRGIEDPTALLKCDLTPHGFHAMVISATHSTVFVDPYSVGDSEHYVVYFKKDLLKQNGESFECITETDDLQELHLGESTAKLQGDCQLRRYRLALACTGEYATFHGSSVPTALAAMNTTMNRVNGVYEIDLAITMQLVPNNNLLVFLNAATDPYSNGNASTMLTENQTTCNNIIGSANYDIGHVFGVGSGGVAGSIGNVCTTTKARGVTGLNPPVGDAFDIDYVAHEMGHQFGGNHTYNGTTGSCGGNANTPHSVEPGSGTTIMAYAGICGAQNVQSNSDDYFHAYNVLQINNYSNNGAGNNCPVKIVTGNNNPVVNAGADYTIPKSTPFALTATGSDVDGDTLTYCWEQMNAGPTTNPPSPTATSGALFRSFKGTTSPTRFFPRLSDLINNVNYAWEELPGVARTLNFRVLARDNNAGAGCTDEDDMVVTVAGTAGPFLVTVPNTNVLWYVGETQTVTWDVSNTDVAPVSCTNVRILLSTDGGQTYPITLAADVPNTGSADIVVPNNLSNTCRVKVEAIGNVFFDISNTNFRIQLPPVPTFSMNLSTGVVQACAGDTVAITAFITPLLGFSDPVNLTLDGAPAGVNISIDPNPATPGSSAEITITGLTPAMAGNYAMTVQATSGTIMQASNVQLNLLPGAPAATAAISPLDGVSGLPLNADLTWNSSPFTEDYIVEVATSPSFDASVIVQTSVQSGASLQTSTLQPGTVYYWRVRAGNDCGNSGFSQTYAFQTGNFECNQIFISPDVPKTIDATTANTVVSILDIPTDKTISDVDVTVIANHTYVGDLLSKLTAPSGTSVQLFDRPGVPASTFGCAGDNLNLIFDDASSQTADQLDATCNTIPPALLGAFQPIAPLSSLNGENAQGIWQLEIEDTFADDGGSLTAWSLTFCFFDAIPDGVLANNNPLLVPAGGNGTIANTNLSLTLSGDDDQSKFTLLSLPAHGTLSLDGTPLGLGGTFTQADINAGLVVYTHNGDGATEDEFLFDATDLNNFAWVHGATFNISIIQNGLAATAAQTQAVLCNNDATGEITVTAVGLDGQYQYSLNGGPNKASNVFSGLTAGTYTVVVTGQFGFTATANSVTLTNPTAITASASVTDDDVTVTAAGGTGALEYSLNGEDFQSSNIFEDLDNGIYTVTVRDENGCTATTEAIVAVNSLLASLQVQTLISCFGGNNGTITVNVGGGQAPYEYSLNGAPFQSSNTFSGLSAGVYSVEVRDNQDFTTTTDEITLTDPAQIMASAAANLNVIIVTASGGTGALEYSINGTDFQPGNTFGNLANGDYMVTVRDANGCTTTAEVTVDVAPLTLVSVVETQGIQCFGEQTGEITVTVSGGIPPYEYALDNGTYQSSNILTGVGGGPHTVQVRDATGTVVESNPIFVQQPVQLVAVVDVTGNDAQFLAFGGTPPYTFNSDAPIPPIDLPNGDYSLTVTDVNGCTSTATFTISVPALAVTFQVVSIDACVGSAVIEVTATGGEPAYQYSLNGGAFQDSPTFTVFAGANNVRVRDAAGTIVQVPVNVQIPTPVSLSATASGDTIFAEAQFGVPPYQYSLNGGAFQDSPVFPDLADGDYTVTVQDNAGCTSTAVVTVMGSGVVEPGAAWGLTIAPNPSTGLFRLTMQSAPVSLRAEVFDAAGRMVRTLDFSPGGGQFSTMLDLQDAPQGMYLLRLTDGTNWGSVRLSVVR